VRGRAPSDQNQILTETRASPWRGTKRLVSAREQVLTPPERNLIQKEIGRGGENRPNMMALGFWDIGGDQERRGRKWDRWWGGESGAGRR